MQKEDLESWWASLSITQKERIARKALKKKSADGQVDESLVLYPACSRWWVALDEESRLRIHDHCVTKHNYLQEEWNDANPFGD